MINGKSRYLITGPPMNSLIRLALPLVVSSLSQNILCLVDMFWVGKIGKAQIAAISVSTLFFLIFTIFTIGFETGILSVVSHFFGEKKYRRINDLSLNIALVSLLAGLVATLLGWLFCGVFFDLFHLKENVYNGAVLYTRVYMAGASMIFFVFFVSAVFRGMGNSMIPLKAILIVNVINFIFDPFLVLGLGSFEGLGIRGAAVSSLLGQGCGVLYLIWKAKKNIILYWKDFSINYPLFKKILQIGMPVSFYIAARMLRNIIFFFLVAQFGTASLSAYGVCQRFILLIMICGLSIGTASATFSGQNVSSGNRQRALRGIYYAVFLYAVLNILSSMVFLFFGIKILGLFNSDADFINAGKSFLFIVAPVLVFNAAGIIIARSSAGTGDTFFPSAVIIGLIMCYELPMAYLLSREGFFGLSGVFIAESSTIVLTSLIMLIWFFSHYKYKILRYKADL